jgi:hypothetical protein
MKNNTDGSWFMLLRDGRKLGFYRDHVKKIMVSPFERIKDFDRGDCWCIDMCGEENIGYPIDPEDDSFCLIPKSDVVQVYFEKDQKS